MPLKMLEERSFHDDGYAELIERAAALRPLLLEHAPRHEQAGHLSQEVVNALDEIGVLKMAAPVRNGGLCLSSSLICEVIREIARGCPSTGWVVSIINSSVWVGSVLSPAMEQYLFGDGVPKLCSPTNGTGTLVARGDRFVVNGRWSYGSGVHHSKWALVPAKSPEGKLNMVALPISEVQIERTWQVAGMKGTGSDTVVAEDMLVSAEQFCEISPVGEYQGWKPTDRSEPTDDRNGIALLRMGILAVLIGTAEGLLQTVMDSKSRPVMFSSHKVRGDSEMFRTGVGRTAAMIRVARTILARAAGISDKAATAAVPLSVSQRAESRAEITVAVELLVKAGEELMSLYGSSGFAESCPAQRYWRDLNVGLRHIVLHKDTGYEIYGCERMGIEPVGYSLDRV